MVQPRQSTAARLREQTGKISYLPGAHRIVDHPVGPDWVHPSIFVRDVGAIGLGLFTLDLIPKGTQVILFGGTLMSWREVTALPEDMHDIPFQVADDIFFGILHREDLGVGERINHSCNPNAGFLSEMKLVAIRDILPGEDVTMDYATCSSMEDYRLHCQCGDKLCRGVVRGSDWQNADLQRRLGNYFQPYLKEKIERQQRRGLAAWIAYRLRNTADFISG